MKRLLTFLLVVSPSLGNDTFFETRIIGGEATSIENYPYQLSLSLKPRHFICGAVLIGSKVALTAAHCVDNPRLPSRYRIRAGSDYPDEDGIVVGVATIAIHPKYVRHEHLDDIAILILARKLRFSDKIRPISLPSENGQVAKGLVGHVTGWGVGSNDELTVVEVPVADYRTCKWNYRKMLLLTDRQFCAGYDDGGKDACQGDSGGPFVSQGVLLGIVSTGHKCALPGMYGIYTKVSAHLDFIRPHLAS